MKRTILSTLFAPIRLCRRVLRILHIENQLLKVQQVGRGYSFGIGLFIGNLGEIIMGNNLEAANFTYLTTCKGGKITLGDNCFLGDNCKLASDQSYIHIGNFCMIAENVSIRASNHGIRRGMNIREQENVFQPINIGDDVWIGKGSTILAGSRIPDGCVIGANSLVLGKSVLRENCVYGGLPVKFLSERKHPISKITE